MVDPALRAEVDALSEGELIELADYIGQRVTRASSPETRLPDDQEALLRSRRDDPDPSHWSTPEETSTFLRGLRA